MGTRDHSFSGTSAPLGTKRAESSLWFNAGTWWANLWDSSSQDFHIWRLNTVMNAWVDTRVTVDTRANTQADTLWDGGKLYIASHVRSDSPASGYPTYLYRFSYDPVGRTYSRDAGFPVQINNYKTKAVVIDKDSTGKLWATWMQGTEVYVNRTLGDDASWGTPFVPAVSGTNTTSDELSSLIAFDGDKIGLMWSNQTSKERGYWFAIHRDGQPDTSWEPSVQARSGAESADDHINLKTDSSGRVYAAVKNSFDAASAPETELLVRRPDTGAWSNYTLGTVAECPNRPIVLVDESQGVLHVLLGDVDAAEFIVGHAALGSGAHRERPHFPCVDLARAGVEELPLLHRAGVVALEHVVLPALRAVVHAQPVEAVTSRDLAR